VIAGEVASLVLQGVEEVALARAVDPDETTAGLQAHIAVADALVVAQYDTRHKH
jgi:hypothetical protein